MIVIIIFFNLFPLPFFFVENSRVFAFHGSGFAAVLITMLQRELKGMFLSASPPVVLELAVGLSYQISSVKTEKGLSC